MAFINGVIGVSRKKVGNLVAYRNSGKAIVRQYLGTGEIANPRTAGQIAQRARFSMIAQQLAQASAFFNRTFAAYRRYFVGFAAAMHFNWADLITGSYPLYTVDHSKLLISKGGLLPLDGLTATANANHSVTLSWTDNSGQANARTDDEVCLMLWLPNLSSTVKMFPKMDVAQRNAGTYADSTPLQLGGEVAHVYVCVHRRGTAKYSNSQYCGSVTLQ